MPALPRRRGRPRPGPFRLRGDNPVQPGASVIQLVSGDNQPGKAGRELVDSLVIRLTDGQGQPHRGVEVTWTVVSGKGAGTWEFVDEVSGATGTLVVE
jgi:hypothetical protein